METTREEFLAKYGKLKVKFSSYYKYTFTYSTTLEDGSVLTCGVGGNKDEIYRLDVSNGREETVFDLDPYVGAVLKDGEEICGFYDY